MKKTTLTFVTLVLAAVILVVVYCIYNRNGVVIVDDLVSTSTLATTTVASSEDVKEKDNVANKVIDSSPLYQLPEEKYRLVTVAGTTYHLDSLKKGDRIGLWTVSDIKPHDTTIYGGVPSGLNLVAEFNGTTTLRGTLSQKGGVHSLEMVLDSDSIKKIPSISASYQTKNTTIFFIGNDDELKAVSAEVADTGRLVDVIVNGLTILRTETDSSGVFTTLVSIKKP